MDGDDQLLVNDLAEVATRMGFTIRYEQLNRNEEYAVQGGEFTLKQQKIILLDPTTSYTEQARILAKALSRMNTDEIYMKPNLREVIDRQNGD